MARTHRTIGVDTGGTFTDLVQREGSEECVVKLPSTPDAPARAVLAGAAQRYEANQQCHCKRFRCGIELLNTDSCRGTVPMEPPMSDSSMLHWESIK